MEHHRIAQGEDATHDGDDGEKGNAKPGAAEDHREDRQHEHGCHQTDWTKVRVVNERVAQ